VWEFIQRGRPVMSCCGTRNFQRLRLKISTAATPLCSLALPPAALASVPTSIRLHVHNSIICHKATLNCLPSISHFPSKVKADPEIDTFAFGGYNVHKMRYQRERTAVFSNPRRS